MPDIYQALHDDHEKVKANLNRILDTTNRAEKTRNAILDEIKHELDLHKAFEEEVFYPSFRKAKNDKEAKEEVKDAVDEHREAEQVIEALRDMDPTTDAFVEKVQALKQMLEHHVSDEEDQIFPQARKVLSDEQARQMGEDYLERKKAA